MKGKSAWKRMLAMLLSFAMVLTGVSFAPITTFADETQDVYADEDIDISAEAVSDLNIKDGVSENSIVVSRDFDWEAYDADPKADAPSLNNNPFYSDDENMDYGCESFIFIGIYDGNNVSAISGNDVYIKDGDGSDPGDDVTLKPTSVAGVFRFTSWASYAEKLLLKSAGLNDAKLYIESPDAGWYAQPGNDSRFGFLGDGFLPAGYNLAYFGYDPMPHIYDNDDGSYTKCTLVLTDEEGNELVPEQEGDVVFPMLYTWDENDNLVAVNENFASLDRSYGTNGVNTFSSGMKYFSIDLGPDYDGQSIKTFAAYKSEHYDSADNLIESTQSNPNPSYEVKDYNLNVERQNGFLYGWPHWENGQVTGPDIRDGRYCVDYFAMNERVGEPLNIIVGYGSSDGFPDSSKNSELKTADLKISNFRDGSDASGDVEIKSMPAEWLALGEGVSSVGYISITASKPGVYLLRSKDNHPLAKLRFSYPEDRFGIRNTSYNLDCSEYGEVDEYPHPNDYRLDDEEWTEAWCRNIIAVGEQVQGVRKPYNGELSITKVTYDDQGDEIESPVPEGAYTVSLYDDEQLLKDIREHNGNQALEVREEYKDFNNNETYYEFFFHEPGVYKLTAVGSQLEKKSALLHVSEPMAGFFRSPLMSEDTYIPEWSETVNLLKEDSLYFVHRLPENDNETITYSGMYVWDDATKTDVLVDEIQYPYLSVTKVDNDSELYDAYKIETNGTNTGDEYGDIRLGCIRTNEEGDEDLRVCGMNLYYPVKGLSVMWPWEGQGNKEIELWASMDKSELRFRLDGEDYNGELSVKFRDMNLGTFETDETGQGRFAFNRIGEYEISSGGANPAKVMINAVKPPVAVYDNVEFKGNFYQDVYVSDDHYSKVYNIQLGGNTEPVTVSENSYDVPYALTDHSFELAIWYNTGRGSLSSFKYTLLTSDDAYKDFVTESSAGYFRMEGLSFDKLQHAVGLISSSTAGGEHSISVAENSDTIQLELIGTQDFNSFEIGATVEANYEEDGTTYVNKSQNANLHIDVRQPDSYAFVVIEGGRESDRDRNLTNLDLDKEDNSISLEVVKLSVNDSGAIVRQVVTDKTPYFVYPSDELDDENNRVYKPAGEDMVTISPITDEDSYSVQFTADGDFDLMYPVAENDVQYIGCIHMHLLDDLGFYNMTARPGQYEKIVEEKYGEVKYFERKGQNKVLRVFGHVEDVSNINAFDRNDRDQWEKGYSLDMANAVVEVYEGNAMDAENDVTDQFTVTPITNSKTGLVEGLTIVPNADAVLRDSYTVFVRADNMFRAFDKKAEAEWLKEDGHSIPDGTDTEEYLKNLGGVYKYNDDNSYEWNIREESFRVFMEPIQNIIVATLPKSSYVEGESFSASGMKVVGSYADGDTVELKPSDYVVSPAGALKTSDKTVTITFDGVGGEKTATVNIKVNAKKKTGDDDDGSDVTPTAAGGKVEATSGAGASSDFKVVTPGGVGKTGKVTYEGEKTTATGTVTIPSTITGKDGVVYEVAEIAPDALKGNTKITGVNIGDNIVTIGSGAFDGATNLKTVTAGKNVTVIKKNAFNKCGSLTSFKAKGNKITTVEDGAFAGTKKLKSADFSKQKLKKLGKNAFKGSGVTNIKLNANTLKTVGKGVLNNVGKKKKVKVIVYAKDKKTADKVIKKLKKGKGNSKLSFKFKKKK